MTTRMAVLARALPKRILLVDDDELELALTADRLKSAGFEVAAVSNGSEALSLLERQWFPLIITDWEMPVMDGIELTERLRKRGVDDTYVIMLTVRATGLDYERGYFSGVDDYITKKLPDAELLARVHKGFSTLAMRRSLKDAGSTFGSHSNKDSESGAYTSEHLHAMLRAECKRAQRYQRNLSVLTLGIRMDGGAPDSATATAVPASLLPDVIATIRDTIRADVDWIGRVDAPAGEAVFAVVLPEAAAVDAVAIKSRLQRALRAKSSAPAPAAQAARPHFSFGFAALPVCAENNVVEAISLITVAEHCRRCYISRGRLQLEAVQASVRNQVAISCRHGYAVETPCQFMVQTPLAVVPRTAAGESRRAHGA